LRPAAMEAHWKPWQAPERVSTVTLTGDV
jgi:hypothetical protein